MHGTINIKLTAYSCICWLFHRINRCWISDNGKGPEVGPIQWVQRTLSVGVQWLEIADISCQSLGYLELYLYCSLRFHDVMLYQALELYSYFFSNHQLLYHRHAYYCSQELFSTSTKYCRHAFFLNRF